ncbi:MAG: AAA family ATPase [Clostridiales bacterium]|jgi:stage V sporulation protein K|nr:AAA family ATPase [Clostridiales bacterium]
MAQDISSKFNKIEEFITQTIGLEQVKATLISFLAVLKFQEKLKGKIATQTPNLHMVFRGNAGTGKTTVAVKLAELYGELGFLGVTDGKPAKLTVLNSANLLTYDATTKAKKLVEEAMGGILLLDEAYAITESSSGVGEDVIAVLLTEMEQHQNELAVIFAGYTEKMYKFMTFNPGLHSRIGANLTFEDYTPDELLYILLQKVQKEGFNVTEEAKANMLDVFRDATRYNDFGNGRFAMRFFQEIITEHSIRTANSFDDAELLTITGADVTRKIIEKVLKSANFKF